MIDDAEAKYLREKHHEVLYCAQLSALYHQKRERHFDLLDKSAKAVAIIGGSASLAKVTTPDALMWIAASITASSTMSLVFSFSDRSKRHSELSRSFRMLEAKIVSKGERDFTEEDLSAWRTELRTLEATEPPALSALVVACQNQLALASGHKDKIVQLGVFKRATMNFFDWQPRAG